MRENYKPFVDRMIQRYEGGYCWNANDRGGPTNYGITCYDLAEFRGQSMDSMEAWAPVVKAMPLSDAEAIYRTKYASAIRFDDLQSGIDCCMMDYAVNSGITRAIRVARSLLKCPGPDYVNLDLSDAFERADARKFVEEMCDERLAFMQGLKNWGTFGKGWTARVADLRAYCSRLAAGTVMPTPIVVPPHPKAVEAPTLWGRVKGLFGGA